MRVHLHIENNKINIKIGVRQGDRYHIAQAVDGSTRKHIPTNNLRKQNLKIDGEYISHLRFADNILICANTPHELQQMLQELADESDNQGLKMNKSKRQRQS